MSEFLNDAYNRKVFNALVKKIFPSTSAEQQPVAVIYGAQPGAGKSGIKSHLTTIHPSIGILDGDEYRRLHPAYDTLVRNDPDNMPHHTQPFVYDLLEHLKDYAHEYKKSYALETTFHNGPKTEETLAEARRKGFRTELHLLAVNPFISYLSTVSRYEIGREQGSVGRSVLKEIHFDRAEKNIDALTYCVSKQVADSVTLYKRIVNGQQSETVQWKTDPKDPIQDFLTERTRSLSVQEKEYYQKTVQSILSRMERTHAPTEQIEAFKKDFRDLVGLK